MYLFVLFYFRLYHVPTFLNALAFFPLFKYESNMSTYHFVSTQGEKMLIDENSNTSQFFIF